MYFIGYTYFMCCSIG